MRVIGRALAGSCLLCLWLSAFAEEWLYTVRPGDEIWNIARLYCGSSTYASRIIEFNQLADERTIRPGSRLRIPIAWLVRQPATAKIVNVRGRARLLNPSPRPATVGLGIEMGNRLETQDGTVVVSFADGSTMIVAPESELLFNVLTAYGDTGMVDTNLRFYRGRATSRIIRRNDASSFRISSPAGTAAVRGTKFRVAVDAEKSLTETLEGEVGFLQDTETSVPAGFGAVASDTGVATEALLPAPSWISAPGSYPAGSSLRWRIIPGAVGYRVGVFAAGDLETPVAQSLVDDASYVLGGLGPAAYVVTVRGVSATELEGYEATLATDLRTAPPVVATDTVFTMGAVTLGWASTDAGAPYTVQVAADEAFVDVVLERTLDGSVLAPSLNPGGYAWRVKDASSTYSQSQAFAVHPPPPTGLATATDELTFSMNWSSDSAPDAYLLQIAKDSAFKDMVVDVRLTDPAFRDAMPTYGNFYVRVRALQNGMESSPLGSQFTLTRPPQWWPLALLAIPILLL